MEAQLKKKGGHDMTLDPINIGIKKAVITRLSVELKETSNGEKDVEITVQGNYLTAQNRVVSDFMFWNMSWSEEKKLDVPQEIKDQLKAVFNQLTPLLYDKVNHMYKELPVVASEAQTDVKEVKEDETVQTEDEIPF